MKMMNDDEIDILWNKMMNIYDIGVEHGRDEYIIDTDNDIYIDYRCYNGYEPLERYVNELLYKYSKEAFNAGIEVAKKGYV